MNQRQRKKLKDMQTEQRGAAIIDGNLESYRQDGYTNLLNKYGTKQDNSTAYRYDAEPIADDMQLIRLYEGNGLFTKIIDRPSEEAVKHGLDIDYGDEDIAEYVDERLDDLEFEDKFATAEKWARLYGGSIIVMLVDDGCGLEEPLNWKRVRSIEELRVFERAIVEPDYTSLYQFHFLDSMKEGKTFGEPEYYQVFSMYGYFVVHRSRCLVFRNGRLPEHTTNALYRYWGIPEYVKIKRALRECITSHTDGVKLLERSVQAIYKMKNLAQLLSTDSGENKVLQRLQIIDMARGILNSIAIDNDGEDYDYKSLTMAGVKDVIDTTCNMLSAVTNIPQTILFGRSPAGENSTGESDQENYYNMVENIQKQNMKANVRTVIDLIMRQGYLEERIPEVPKYKVKFAALWSMSEREQAEIDQIKAGTEQTKAATAAVYMENSVIDPTEVRRNLAKEGNLEIEELITEEDLELPEDTFDYMEQNGRADGGPGSGNFGHEGRPGQVGGSAGGGGEGSSAEAASSYTPPTTALEKMALESNDNAAGFLMNNGVGWEEAVKLHDSGKALDEAKKIIDKRHEGYSERYSQSPEGQKKLMRMTPKEADDFVKDCKSKPCDSSLNQGSTTQHVVNELDLNDKPRVLGKAEFEKAVAESPSGIIYRGVIQKGDLSAEDICKLTTDSEKQYVGYGFNGDGTYFSSRKETAESYANQQNGGMMTACLSKDARIISSRDLGKAYSDFPISDQSSRALYMGYNVIAHEANRFYDGTVEMHYITLDRSALCFLDEHRDSDDDKIKKVDGNLLAYAWNAFVQEDRTDGGPGSGNWGHSGVPGSRGGSAPGGGVANRKGSKESGYSSEAKEKKIAKSGAGSVGSGSSMKRPEAQDKAVKDIAKKTANLKNEEYRIVGKDGSVLLEKSGDRNSVAATVGEKREYMNNALSIHNHPDGGTFSKQDLNDFGFGATEMVVSAPEGTYTLTNEKYGTQDQYKGWYDMQQAMEQEIPEASALALRKQAQENLKNSEEAKQMDDISKKWVGMKEAGASNEELNEYYKSSGYDDLAKAQKQKIDAEERRLETQPFDDFYRQNASKYGFSYKFEPSGKKHDGRSDGADTKNGTAVIVIQDGLILCGDRTDGKGICGPGGHVQDDETPEQGAVRECQEEFGITPEHLIHLGLNKSNQNLFRPSEIYLTDEYSGEVSCDDGEMRTPRWLSIEELRQEKLFPAFENSLELLQQTLRKYVQSEGTNAIIKIEDNADGGQGSGNFGHAGVPGQRGGSASAGTSQAKPAPKTSGQEKQQKREKQEKQEKQQKQSGPHTFQRIGASMKITTDVKMKKSYTIPKGEKITKIYDFAGGGKKTLRVADKLASQFGGDQELWTHARGETTVEKNGTRLKAEVHWFECKGIGQVGFKMKTLIGGGNT